MSIPAKSNPNPKSNANPNETNNPLCCILVSVVPTAAKSTDANISAEARSILWYILKQVADFEHIDTSVVWKAHYNGLKGTIGAISAGTSKAALSPALPFGAPI